MERTAAIATVIIEAVIIALLVPACDLPSNKPVQETINFFEVYFCPQDLCEEKLIEVIKSSKDVSCALYDISLPQLKDALNNANARVVVDKGNKEHAQGLLNVRYNEGMQSMHNKFCILDDMVMTGSWNPTPQENRNNVVMIRSSALAAAYLQEFEELWSGTFGSGKRSKRPVFLLNTTIVETYFCPEDMCQEKVLQRLEAAKGSVYFLTFSFTDSSIAAALIEKSHSLDVKGIFEKSRENSLYEQYKSLEEAGLDVMPDKEKGLLHHKVFIIDNSTVITDSMNPTKSANERNDENLLIIHDERIAKKYMEEFERLWENQ